MGSLNTFYLMGRVARAAEPVGQRHGHPVVVFGLSTSAQGREPVMLEASGPQAEQARHLRMGQGVFVRGLLRVDAGEGGRPTLVAQVQALDAVIDGARLRPRPPREGDGAGAEGAEAGAEGAEGAEAAEGAESAEGEPGVSGGRRRPRRRRGRRRPEGARAGGEGGAPEGAPSGEGAPQEARPARPELPPPAQIAAPPQPVQPKPDPTYRSDMPF